MIAECLSLQRLGVGLPGARPAWESNLGPPASEIGSLTTGLSVQRTEHIPSYTASGPGEPGFVGSLHKLRGYQSTVEKVLLGKSPYKRL